MNDAIKTQVSAFVDGELPDNESELLLRRLSQDFDLRQQAAEYFAIGRAMRGHRGVKGIERLRERIGAEIDDTTLSDVSVAAHAERSRFSRPLAGVAIAATVALAAILGLQQVGGIADIDLAPGASAVAEIGGEGAYTVPVQPDEQLLQYRMLHNEAGGNINARLVSLQLREGEVVDSEATDDIDAAPDTVIDELQDEQTQ